MTALNDDQERSGFRFKPEMTLGNLGSILIFIVTMVVMGVQYGDRIQATETALKETRDSFKEQQTINGKLSDSIAGLNVNIAALTATINAQTEQRKQDRWYDRGNEGTLQHSKP